MMVFLRQFCVSSSVSNVNTLSVTMSKETFSIFSLKTGLSTNEKLRSSIKHILSDYPLLIGRNGMASGAISLTTSPNFVSGGKPVLKP